MPSSPRRLPSPLVRRRLLLGAAWAAAASAWAAPRVAPRAEGPEVGVDPALVASGLTARWSQAMQRDLGWTARWTPLPSGVLLRQLEQGEVDMALYLSHPLAARLARQGLIHDQHPLARTAVLLVGPAQDAAGIRSETDPTRALRQVLAAHAAGAALWQPPPTDSALAALVEGLGLGPGIGAPPPQAKGKLLADTPYRLVTQAEWLAEQAARGRAPSRNGNSGSTAGAPTSRVWLQGGPGLHLDCELARSFRARHPGARLLVQWLQGPLGRQAFQASAPAWQALQG